MIKQVIVMNTSLNMRKGKMVAQGAHATMKVLLDQAQIVGKRNTEETRKLVIDNLAEAMESWISGIFTKICVGVDSEAKLDELYAQAKAAGLPCAMIVDNGLTEFKGVPTKTCIAIGPDEAEKIDLITGGLKLL